MGVNTTGRGDVNAYRLGRGKLYLASLNATTKKPDNKGWRFLGNCTEFNISAETEKLEHTSSLSGLKTVDAEVIISQKMNLAMSLDEIDFDNLSLFFSGDVITAHADVANAAYTGFGITNQDIIDAKVGRWYDLEDSNGRRAYDLRVSGATTPDLTVAYGASPTFASSGTEGTDYEVDRVMGRVFILTTGGISDDDDLRFNLTANGTVQQYVEEVRGLKNTATTGALKFIGVNAKTGKKQEVQFHQVSLKPEGDLALIGEEWSTISLSGSVESNATASANSPYVTIRDHADS